MGQPLKAARAGWCRELPPAKIRRNCPWWASWSWSVPPAVGRVPAWPGAAGVVVTAIAVTISVKGTDDAGTCCSVAGLVAWLDPYRSAHVCRGQWTRQRGACCVRVLIRQSCGSGAARRGVATAEEIVSAPSIPRDSFHRLECRSGMDPAISCRAVDTGRGDWPIFDADERPASERYLYQGIPSALR